MSLGLAAVHLSALLVAVSVPACRCARDPPQLDDAEARRLLSEALEPVRVYCRTGMPVRSGRIVRPTDNATDLPGCRDALLKRKLVDVRVAEGSSEDGGVFHDRFEAIPKQPRSREDGGFLAVECGELGVRVLQRVNKGRAVQIEFDQPIQVDQEALKELAPCRAKTPELASPRATRTACFSGERWSLRCQ